MLAFSYIARTTEGTLERGTIDASSAEEAREQLRKKHLFVEELQTNSGKPAMEFAGSAMPWVTTEDDPPSAPVITSDSEEIYVPLTDTLRLFAGWLLAWYAVVYLLGSYQRNGKLPLEIPFLEGLFISPLVLRFSLGTFLFLLLTTIHRWLKGGIISGILLTLLGVALFVLFHLNV